jgi:hypothetical protein
MNKFEIIHEGEKQVRESIKYCQKEGHVQQVAYSTYHDAITQICFNCKMIYTSFNEGDLDEGAKR